MYFRPKRFIGRMKKKTVTTESNDFFASDSDGCILSSHASPGGVKEIKKYYKLFNFLVLGHMASWCSRNWIRILSFCWYLRFDVKMSEFLLYWRKNYRNLCHAQRWPARKKTDKCKYLTAGLRKIIGSKN